MIVFQLHAYFQLTKTFYLKIIPISVNRYGIALRETIKMDFPNFFRWERTINHHNRIIMTRTLNRRSMLATMMETTLNDAPMTAVTGLCGTYTGGLPDSHLYSDISCNNNTNVYTYIAYIYIGTDFFLRIQGIRYLLHVLRNLKTSRFG